MRSIELEITPEPTDAERAALAALVSGERDGSATEDPTGWRRAALEEGVAADDEYRYAPTL